MAQDLIQNIFFFPEFGGCEEPLGHWKECRTRKLLFFYPLKIILFPPHVNVSRICISKINIPWICWLCVFTQGHIWAKTILSFSGSSVLIITSAGMYWPNSCLQKVFLIVEATSVRGKKLLVGRREWKAVYCLVSRSKGVPREIRRCKLSVKGEQALPISYNKKATGRKKFKFLSPPFIWQHEL